MDLKRLQIDILKAKIASLDADGMATGCFPWQRSSDGVNTYIVTEFFGCVVPSNWWLMDGVFLGDPHDRLKLHRKMFDDSDITTFQLMDRTVDWNDRNGKPTKLLVLENEDGHDVYINEKLIKPYWKPEKCKFAQARGKLLSPVFIYEDDWKLSGLVCPVNVMRGKVWDR